MKLKHNFCYFKHTCLPVSFLKMGKKEENSHDFLPHFFLRLEATVHLFSTRKAVVFSSALLLSFWLSLLRGKISPLLDSIVKLGIVILHSVILHTDYARGLFFARIVKSKKFLCECLIRDSKQSYLKWI